MITMSEVVQDAFEEIGVKTAEVPLTDDEMQSGIRRCNDMLTEWDDTGTISGYTPVIYASDEISVDRNAVGAIKLNLAIRLSSSFQAVVTPALAANADSSLSALRASNAFIGRVAFPDTLPMGSGNQCGDDYHNDTFFPGGKKGNF